jgi:hypothetical protein
MERIKHLFRANSSPGSSRKRLDQLIESRAWVLWSLIEGGFGLLHVNPEVDDPHVARSACDVEPVHPRTQHVGVTASIGVGSRQQSTGSRGVNIESTALGVAHE